MPIGPGQARRLFDGDGVTGGYEKTDCFYHQRLGKDDGHQRRNTPLLVCYLSLVSKRRRRAPQV